MMKSPFALAFLLTIVVGCGTGEANNDIAPPADDTSLADTGDASADDVGAGDAAADVAPGPMGVEKLFAQGPHPVGFAEFDLTYMPPGATEMRVVPVKAWYPAAADAGAEAARYAGAGIVDVVTEVALDSPDGADGTFPVVVYSHGSGGEGLLAYPYGENFASWGWVVVSPNHVGNTALDAIRNELAPFAANLLYRVTDISALLDSVSAGTGTPLDGHADTDQVLLFGHSFGGYTTLAAGGADYDYDGLFANCPVPQDDGSCDFLALPEVEAAFGAGFGDDRIDAIVAQAPALVGQFAAGEITGIEVPTMIQSGDLDITTPNATQAEPAWNALDGGDDRWVRMPTGAHFTFISICYDLSEMLLLTFRPNANMDGCGEAFIDPREAVPVLHAYLRAFGETHVLGSDEWVAVLDGTEPLDDGFTMTTP
jgi:predicted dienelactone hydrolase